MPVDCIYPWRNCSVRLIPHVLAHLLNAHSLDFSFTTGNILEISKNLALFYCTELKIDCENQELADEFCEQELVAPEQANALKFVYEAVKGAWLQSVFTSPPLVAQSSAFQRLEYTHMGWLFGWSMCENPLLDQTTNETVVLDRLFPVRIHLCGVCTVARLDSRETQSRSHRDSVPTKITESKRVTVPAEFPGTSFICRSIFPNIYCFFDLKPEPEVLSKDSVRSFPLFNIFARPSPQRKEKDAYVWQVNKRGSYYYFLTYMKGTNFN
ncbi:methionine aminopeptidase 1B [Striga asiatica]|uniref:Methionine aminopeptidase 1B n=1 Tax=Striga asiatica TaxID=4170 RepID=A0A5A7Q9Z0_STRAF|nr:methionine aminopeptidase 1B [Striga asiatica]